MRIQIAISVLLFVGALRGQGQDYQDSVLMELGDCLWSTDNCVLAWKLVDEAGCKRFDVTNPAGQVIARLDPFLDPKVLSHGSSDHVDTVFSLLFSYQLLRHGEPAMCGATGEGRIVRLTCIDHLGAQCMRLTCTDGRCTGSQYSEAANPWLLAETPLPERTRFIVRERKLDKALCKLRKVDANLTARLGVLGYWMLVEEQVGTEVHQVAYSYRVGTKKKFRRVLQRLAL